MAVYELITKTIIEMLDKGVIPWHRPWKVRMPVNLVSGKPYRGINILMLSFSSSPYWLTERQAERLGGSVKKGEEGLPVVYWNWIKVKGKDGKDKNVPFLKYHTVYNPNQCENIPIPNDSRIEFNPILECERVIDEMPDKPIITFGGDSACYITSRDLVCVPNREHFENKEEFYSTMFHELVHSTGNEKRLDRKSISEPHAFGSETYSNEELVAELGSSFLCGITGIGNMTMQNQAGYIGGWLQRLKDDKKLIVLAASQAQKACDFIRGGQNIETLLRGNQHGKD